MASDRNLKKPKYLVDRCHLDQKKGRNIPETKDFIGNCNVQAWPSMSGYSFAVLTLEF